MALRQRLSQVWPSLLALAGTVAVVTALLVLFGGEVEPGEPLDDAIAGGEPATGSPIPGEGGSTDEPTGEATDDATGDATGDASPEPTGDDTAEAAVRVVVLNQTQVSGLANRTAEVLRENGWEVVQVGDFPSGVPSTTVYYPEGLEDAALALDEAFDGIDRVRPVFAGLRDDVLTLVLAETDATPTPTDG